MQVVLPSACTFGCVNAFTFSTVNGNGCKVNVYGACLFEDLHFRSVNSEVFVGNRGQNSCFEGSAARKTRTALFRVITQRIVVISYRRLGTTYRFPLKIGPLDCPKTSVRNLR